MREMLFKKVQQERGKGYIQKCNKKEESLCIEVQQERGKAIYRSATRIKKVYIQKTQKFNKNEGKTIHTSATRTRKVYI